VEGLVVVKARVLCLGVLILQGLQVLVQARVVVLLPGGVVVLLFRLLLHLLLPPLLPLLRNYRPLRCGGCLLGCR